MTAQTARQRILAYLGQHRGASAAEVSRALRVTAANVRRHLAILAADGRVQSLGARPADGPGRPVQIYGLADAGLGDHLAGLAGALLAQMAESVPAEKQDAFLLALALRLLPVKAETLDGLHITRRLAAGVDQLNRLGYAARWEAHAAAPRIIFEHCPYRALVEKHPELCRMDGFLLAQALGRDVEQTAKLEKNTRGTLFCQFVLGLGGKYGGRS